MKAIWILGLLVLGGCSSTPNTPRPDDPEFAPVYGESEPVSMRPTGAIFQPDQVNGIYSDIKAHKVGDIITIELAESTSASKKANTQSGKNNSLNIAPGQIGGIPLELGKYNLSASLGQNSAFKGQAKADQSNSLQGNISVSVAKVLPNGNLVVRGEKWIMLNNGNEYIRITGLIRPEDVTSENSVSSQKVANARIHYGGTGDLANSQEQGWLTSFFNGPWWPL
ncbi:flagellar basal body L-ring protein FlgH [Aeromonas australiensis]|uniref:flagellar basal body L-ring protein FlgH n=1 Tax=Aeromonas australiensis TaxID=1114880 RepID=UPI001F4326E0|nr:flagellar basal body L-ring protein FlgH [Aeromonas australiensis]MCF3097776.1 flagellar basal body L-ring protein FlgH [Aeromonas australiensis]